MSGRRSMENGDYDDDYYDDRSPRGSRSSRRGRGRKRRDMDEQRLDALTEMLYDLREQCGESGKTFGRAAYMVLLTFAFLGASGLASQPPTSLLGKRNPLQWQTQSGTVLAAGMQYLGTCDLGGRGDAADVQQGNYSACSPFTWCSRENERCQCKGTIRFGDGGSINVFDKEVDGGMDCSAKAFGTDPAKGTKKNCYCRPEALSSISTSFEATNQKCDTAATHILQQGVPNMGPSSALSLTATTNRSVVNQSVARDAAPLELLSLGDLTGGASCSHKFLTWGLVAMPGPSPGTTIHRCAYRYGSPKLSAQSDGALSSDLLSNLKQSLGKSWPCEVVPGTMPVSCVVALRQPSGGLIDRWREAFQGILQERFQTCWAVLALCFLACLVISWWRFQQSSDDEKTSRYRRMP